MHPLSRENTPTSIQQCCYFCGVRYTTMLYCRHQIATRITTNSNNTVMDVVRLYGVAVSFVLWAVVSLSSKRTSATLFF